MNPVQLGTQLREKESRALAAFRRSPRKDAPYTHGKSRETGDR